MAKSLVSCFFDSRCILHSSYWDADKEASSLRQYILYTHVYVFTLTTRISRSTVSPQTTSQSYGIFDIAVLLGRGYFSCTMYCIFMSRFCYNVNFMTLASSGKSLPIRCCIYDLCRHYGNSGVTICAVLLLAEQASSHCVGNFFLAIRVNLGRPLGWSSSNNSAARLVRLMSYSIFWTIEVFPLVP